MDVGLIVYLTAWYLGNYYYNIYNKNAGKASGGAEFAFTLATIQLVVGSVYAIFLWVAPDARKAPKLSFAQVMQLAPLGFWAAVAHAGAVYAMTAGAVSFGQIVKAGEPVFAVIVGYLAYSSKVSMAKLLCLIPVIGGIAIASAKVCAAAANVAIAAAAAAVPAWRHHSTAERAREHAMTDGGHRRLSQANRATRRASLS